MSSEWTRNSVVTPQTVAGRVLGILEASAPEQSELSLVDISRRTGLALSTTHRLIAQLYEWGALDRAPDRRYRLGKRLRAITSGPDCGISAGGAVRADSKDG